MSRTLLVGVFTLAPAPAVGAVGSRPTYPTSAACAVTCWGLIVAGGLTAWAGLTKRRD